MAKRFNPKYKINLVEVFNRAYADKSREFRDAIRPSLSSSGFKRLYGRAVIDEIYDRTTSGIDKKGKPLGTYSKIYRESLEFKIYKPGKRIVDLKLTGDMLSDIKHSDSRFTMVFGFNEQYNRNKAHGHITGKYGKTGRTNKRDFFGLPEDNEEKLLKEVIKIVRGSDEGVIADLFEAAVAATAAAVRTGEDDAG